MPFIHTQSGAACLGTMVEPLPITPERHRKREEFIIIKKKYKLLRKKSFKKTTIDQPIHYDHPLGAPPFLYVNPEHFSGAKQFI